MNRNKARLLAALAGFDYTEEEAEKITELPEIKEILDSSDDDTNLTDTLMQLSKLVQTPSIPFVRPPMEKIAPPSCGKHGKTDRQRSKAVAKRHKKNKNRKTHRKRHRM